MDIGIVVADARELSYPTRYEVWANASAIWRNGLWCLIDIFRLRARRTVLLVPSHRSEGSGDSLQEKQGGLSMQLLNVVQVLFQAILALSIPIALITYLNSKHRERREQEYNAYNALDEKYIEYLKMCIQHPKLDLYHLPLERDVTLSPEERVQQYALCEILISLLERSFVMYHEQATPRAKSQWEGSWDPYMRDWAEREIFQRLWAELGNQFDDEFVNHMHKYVVAAASRKASQRRAL